MSFSDNHAAGRGGEDPRRSQLTVEQRGLLVAVVVAFLGIAYVGPALTRLSRRPTLSDRMTRRLRAAKRQAFKARARASKQARRFGDRLGGGPIWR